MMFRKRGQSILEYTLLITAVVLAVVYGANMIISKKAKAHMETAGTIMETANTTLQNSIGGATGGTTPQSPQ